MSEGKHTSLPKFGDRVHSFKTKGREAFDGVVTFIGVNGGKQPETIINVRDDEGFYWHRTPNEIALIT